MTVFHNKNFKIKTTYKSALALAIFLIFIIMPGIAASQGSVNSAKNDNSTPGGANSANTLRVTFLDVWQGDCEIIRTPSGKVIMIDAGDREDNKKQNIAETRILPYLKANGINKIDILVITHPHADHIGGLLSIVPKIPIGIVYENMPTTTMTYKSIIEMFKQKNIPVQKLWKGDKLDFGDGIDVTVLHPPKQWITLPINCGVSTLNSSQANNSGHTYNSSKDMNASDTNETNTTIKNQYLQSENLDLKTVVRDVTSNLNQFSIVLRMKYKNIVYQFDGDAENEAQTEMIVGNKKELTQTDVYKVAHHGSKTSSRESFIAKIVPAVSILSCGTGNKFGHPASYTLQTLKKYNNVIYRTDLNKTIESVTDGLSVPQFFPEKVHDVKEISENMLNKISTKSDNREKNIDYFASYLKSCGGENLKILSPTIKKAVDMLKYDSYQNKSDFDNLKKKIDVLQELYDKSAEE